MKNETVWYATSMFMLTLMVIMVICLAVTRAEIKAAEKRLAALEGEFMEELQKQSLEAPVIDEEPMQISTVEDEIRLPPVEDNTAMLEPEWQDYVLRVITAEGGTDFAVCAGVTQCLFNACEKDGWVHTPKEMMIRYRWTGPASWISAEAEQAFDEIFCSGVTYTAFGKATVFYAPAYGHSAYHESQRFVCETGGVRFFEEVG